MSPTRLQIRELRSARGWSQADLAREAGIHRKATISDYETGRSSLLNLATLEKIARAFGVSVGMLFIDAPASRGPSSK